MTIVRYKCTTCKREIEIPENKRGLEVINRCVITEDCRGTLYRINRKQDFIRGEFPPKVPGLTDYTARRVLYNHTQAVAAKEWYIEHNLGVAPSVQILINVAAESEEEYEDTPCSLRATEGNFDQVEITDYTVTITSPNTLTITFTDPVSGLAQMIARSTAPTAVATTTVTETPSFQLTSNSLLTIATRNNTVSSSSSIDLNVVYTPPGSTTTTVLVTYDISTSVASSSPWSGFSTIQIEGKNYTVRSFDAFVSEMVDGTIPNGSSFYFSQIDDGSLRDINSQEVVILLAQSPYENIDKITNQLIDVNRVDATNAELALFRQDRELFAFTSIISSTFPPIREV